jgi:hypothetical protein
MARTKQTDNARKSTGGKGPPRALIEWAAHKSVQSPSQNVRILGRALLPLFRVPNQDIRVDRVIVLATQHPFIPG